MRIKLGPGIEFDVTEKEDLVIFKTPPEYFTSFCGKPYRCGLRLVPSTGVVTIAYLDFGYCTNFPEQTWRKTIVKDLPKWWALYLRTHPKHFEKVQVIRKAKEKADRFAILQTQIKHLKNVVLAMEEEIQKLCKSHLGT